MRGEGVEVGRSGRELTAGEGGRTGREELGEMDAPGGRRVLEAMVEGEGVVMAAVVVDLGSVEGCGSTRPPPPLPDDESSTVVTAAVVVEGGRWIGKITSICSLQFVLSVQHRYCSMSVLKAPSSQIKSM